MNESTLGESPVVEKPLRKYRLDVSRRALAILNFAYEEMSESTPVDRDLHDAMAEVNGELNQAWARVPVRDRRKIIYVKRGGLDG